MIGLSPTVFGVFLTAVGAPAAFGESVKAERCTIEGKEFHDRFRDIEVAGSRLVVVDEPGSLVGFTIDPSGPCRLKLDRAFGKDGVLALGVDHLSRDDEGDLFASAWIGPNGTGRGYFVPRDGSPFKCDTRGTTALHPGGNWAISQFSYTTTVTLERVTIDREARTCRRKIWQRKKGFIATSVRVLSDEVYVGGQTDESVDRNQTRLVRVYDKVGREIRHFGGRDSQGDDGFDWVESVGVCSLGLCVLDTNRYRISVWQRDGRKHLGNIDLKKVVGAEFWPAGGRVVDPGGQIFYVTGSEGMNKDGRIYRLTIGPSP